MSRWWVITLCCFTLSACKTSNITSGKIRDITFDEVERQLLSTQLHFTTFSAKAKMDVLSGEESQSINASIDMQKDAYIGISLRLLGIEGVRVLITPDSIKIIDRINQIYYPRSFDFLEQNFGVRLDFETLQNLIAGNLIFYKGNKYPGTPDDAKYVLWANDGSFKNTIWLYPSFHVMRMQIDDLLHPRSMTLEYTGYQKTAGQVFAFIRQLQLQAVDNYNIRMEFTTLTLDQPVEFSFTVNPKYEVVH